MPLRLNVGLQKKVGLPDYGSLGASCNVEVELEGSLIERDLESFQRHVQNAFTACRQAVQDELARQQPSAVSPGENGHGAAPNGNGHTNGASRPAVRVRPSSGLERKATKSQVRALHAIADRQRLDLAAELQQRFGMGRPEDLSIKQASGLIDEFNRAPVSGSRA